MQPFGRAERVDDVLVGIEDFGRAEVVVPLLESSQPVALAELDAAAVALERVDRKLFDQLEMAVALVGLEEGECDRLHEVFFHLDDVVETVADHQAVGLDAGRDDGLLGVGGDGGEQQAA